MPLADLQNPYLAPGSRLDFSLYQRPFIESNAHTTFFAGGWRSGKTTAALGFIAVSAFIDAPGCTGIVIQPTHRMLGEFVSTFFRPAFRHLIAGEEKGAGVVHLLNGSRVVFLSGHEPDRIEMYTAAWGYCDEIGIIKRGREVLTKLTARCSDKRAKRRRVGFTGVPYYGWLRDEFQGRADSSRLMLSARTADNRHNAPEYIDELKANCPARLVDAYLNGKFVPPGFVVYPEIDEAQHLVDFDPLAAENRDLQVIPLFDFSPRTPHCLIATILPAGRTMSNGIRLDKRSAIIIDEVIPDGTGGADPVRTEKLARTAAALGYTFRSPGNFFIADPAGEAAEASSGMDQIHIIKDVLQIDAKFQRAPRLRNINNGVEHVKTMLQPTVGEPSLFFRRELARQRSPRGVWNAMHEYHYPKDRDGKAAGEQPEKDGITDHAADLVRYLSINEFKIVRLQSRSYNAA